MIFSGIEVGMWSVNNLKFLRPGSLKLHIQLKCWKNPTGFRLVLYGTLRPSQLRYTILNGAVKKL